MVVCAQFIEDSYEDITDALDRGEVVEILVPDKPAFRLIHSDSPSPVVRKPRVLGAGKGEWRVPSDEEWDAMDREWRQSYADKFGLDQQP